MNTLYSYFKPVKKRGAEKDKPSIQSPLHLQEKLKSRDTDQENKAPPSHDDKALSNPVISRKRSSQVMRDTCEGSDEETGIIKSVKRVSSKDRGNKKRKCIFDSDEESDRDYQAPPTPNESGDNSIEVEESNIMETTPTSEAPSITNGTPSLCLQDCLEEGNLKDCAGHSATIEGYFGNCSTNDDRSDKANEIPPANDETDNTIKGDGSEKARPLLLFYDSETTGRSVYNEHIMEIAAKVIGVPLSLFSQPTFSSLVKTNRNISQKVSDITGITNARLYSEKPLSVVLPEFFKWIRTSTQEYINETGCAHYPVLVSHNGYGFDFPILLAEIERRPEKLSLSQIHSLNIHFADTLVHLKLAKRNGHSSLQSVTKFGLESLYSHFFGNEEYAAHRTLANVEAMERIMTKTALEDLLLSLPIRSLTQQLENWSAQKTTHDKITRIQTSLGKCITYTQAQRLNALGLSYEALQDLRSSCTDKEQFSKILLKKGLKSKPVRDKLKDLVKPKQ